MIPCIKRHKYRVCGGTEVPVIHICLQVMQLKSTYTQGLHRDSGKTISLELDQLLTEI